MKSDAECAALVLGLDSHGLAAARALADAGVPVYALERDRRAPGARSNRVREVFWTDSFEEKDLLPALLSVRPALRSHDKVALLANNDRQVEIIGRHIEELRGHYRIAWADCARTVLELQRKDSLELAARRSGLSYPRSVVLSEVASADAASDFSFPIIIKPVRPLSSFKTLMARDVEELKAHLAVRSKDLPILAQEYISGDDKEIYFAELVVIDGKAVYGLTGRKVVSHPPARGQAIVAEIKETPEVLELSKRFFAGTGLSGPAALELKRDASGGWWVIEPTIGRTEFLVEICIGAGFNVPLLEFQIACGLPLTLPTAARDCVWYDAERDPFAYLRLVWQQKSFTPFGKPPVFPFFAHRDPRPLFCAAWQSAVDTVRQVLLRG